MVRRVLNACALAAMLAVGGCQLFGIAATRLPDPTVPAAYDGLGGQRTAIMIWVDPAVRIDRPQLGLHLAKLIQGNLEKARDEGGRDADKVLEGLTFPVAVESVVRYQRENPELEFQPVASFAPKLPVDRLIYIEVQNFTTQGGAVEGLWRGVMDVNLTVLENPDAATSATTRAGEEPLAETAYQESDLRLIWPPNSPEEGEARLNERVTYSGTLQYAAQRLAQRFYPYVAEE